VSVLRAAVGLTIWIDAVALFILFAPRTPDWLDLPVTFVAMSHYLWMLMRWILVLTLLVRRARANRLRTARRAPMLRLTFATIGHALLGFLSLMGWLMIAINTRTIERVMGLVFHVAVPTLVVGLLARGIVQQEVEGVR
jgi:hypothetical protein